MLLVKLDNLNHDFIVTLSEKAMGLESGYRMELYSPFTKETFSFMLPDNISENPERYDHFKVDASFFPLKKVGTYEYKIYGYDTVNNEDIGLLETGVLKVIDTQTSNTSAVNDLYQSITPDEDADDFMVYDSENVIL